MTSTYCLFQERRAAKQASKPSSSTPSTRTSKTSSPASRKGTDRRSESPKVSSKQTIKTTAQSVTNPPSEIVINVIGSGSTTSSPKSAKVSSRSTSSSKAGSPGPAKSNSSPSRSATDTKKREHSNYKSLGKLGSLSKQKSYSSQHLDRPQSAMAISKYDSEMSPSSKKSLSPKPSSLFPHPPEGRPPSRGSSMRQSSSTPDLRFIDAAIKTEDLKKPLPSRSLSPKGGRPQAPDREIKQHSKTEEKKPHHKDTKSRKDKGRASPDRRKANEAKRVENIVKTKTVVTPEKDISSLQKTKASPSKTTLPNPLELLEQELTQEEETEIFNRFDKQNIGYEENEVYSELDPIQTATAELFPHPISEEQALATLDSLQSDFASLEQADALPKDYNGIPLTSLKQQQIIHMLTKLSKALNMEDTLTSTMGSSSKPEHAKDARGQGSKSENWSDSRSVPNGASGRNVVSYQGVETGGVILTDDPSDIHESVNSNSFQNLSGSSAHSRARMSPTGSSILSSASSVSASRSRMSPKSLKNTVHFSTMVTEISTSASQSYEDKISYRKLDITPKNSENFEEGDTGEVNAVDRSAGSESRDGQSGAMASGLNLLGKVALSPSVDTSSSSPGEFQGDHPFEDGNPDGELNTSDKENEYIPPPDDESNESHSGSRTARQRNPYVWNVYMANIPQGPLGENHPALSIEKSGLKAELAETGPKDNHEKVVLQENLARKNVSLEALDTQYHYGTSGNDIERLFKDAIAPDSSISSLQEEITRSYMLSQKRPDLIKHGGQIEVATPVTDIDNSATSELDIDESAIHLEPIVLTGGLNTLQENRTMLDDEEQIRNNLQRVLFDDSSDESEEGEEESSCNKLNTTFDITDNDHENAETYDNGIPDSAETRDDKMPVEDYLVEEIVEMNDEHEFEDDSNHKEISEEENEIIGDNDDENMEVLECETEESEESEQEDEAEICNEKDGNVVVVETESKPMVSAETKNVDMIDKVCEETKHERKANVDMETHIKVTEHEEEAVNGDAQENEAKAEHIQKYLSQVHEQSLHTAEDFENDDDDAGANKTRSENVMDDIGTLIQSFTSTIQSMNHLSQEELFKIQTEQFELIQKTLIEHQQAQLEELFVSQRREQMNLQEEMEVSTAHRFFT